MTSILRKSNQSLNPLFKMAVVTGVAKSVQMHIDRGDNVDARDGKGLTPLMLAASKNKASICELLINAGADALLMDESGRTALKIAVESNAQEAANILVSAYAKTPNVDQKREIDLEENSSPTLGCNFDPLKLNAVIKPTVEPDTEAPLKAPEAEICKVTWIATLQEKVVSNTQFEVVVGRNESPTESFDLSLWEPEDEQDLVPGDATLGDLARELNDKISAHAPVDSDASWDDFDAYLPDESATLRGFDNDDSRDRLRAILLRSVREGSIPDMQIEDLTRNDDETLNEASSNLIRQIINDLGAETDERFEYVSPFDDFTVPPPQGETFDESVVVDEAKVYLDGLLSKRAEPIRHYLRDAQRTTLLSAPEELALAKRIEAAYLMLIESISLFPCAVVEVLEFGRRLRSGDSRIYEFVDGLVGASHPNFDDHLEESFVDDEENDDEVNAHENGEDTLKKVVLDYIESSETLYSTICAELISNKFGSRPFVDAQAALLANIGPIRFKTPTIFFLIEKVDAHVESVSNANTDCAITSGIGAPQLPLDVMVEFRKQINQSSIEWLQAKEEFTLANLRMVIPVAKKALRSGIPFDDLIQEGNIGLMRAVEKFDWRRGYRFSTYATNWIFQAVTRSVANDGKQIRVPVHANEKIWVVQREIERFESQNGKKPSFNELMSLTKLPEKKLHLTLTHKSII